MLVAALPARPDLLFFGPREADMRVGRKNRLIALSQRAIPFRPDKRGLVDVARRVDAVFARGSRLAIAPEGRIHAGERVEHVQKDADGAFTVTTTADSGPGSLRAALAGRLERRAEGPARRPQPRLTSGT